MAPRSASRCLALFLLIWLHFVSTNFSIPEGIQKAAQAQGESPAECLEKVMSNARAYQESNQIAGRVDFMNELKKVLKEDGLRFLIGGKSLGKSKIVETLVTQEGDDFRVLKLDMREFGSKNVLECLQEQARRSWNQRNAPPWLEAGLNVLQGALKKVGAATAKTDGATGGAEFAIAALLGLPKPEDFLATWVEAVRAVDKLPVIVIDEANMAFPSISNGNGNGKQEASDALQALVRLTKQNRKVSVILVASDYAFPLGLQELGLNKFDCISSTICPEVEEEPMVKLLTEEWGLPQDLAKEFYENFGGNVFLCEQAMIKLLQQFSMGEEDLFDPLSIRADDGLGDLVKDPLTQEHMANLAEKGWSAIEDGSAEEETKSQRAARIIARKNFGAIIDKSTTTFLDEALKQDMFPENVRRRVLIPPTTYTRKCIQWMVKSMTMNSSTGAPTPSFVWVRQLRQEGNVVKEMEDEVAFRKTGLEYWDVDGLKKALNESGSDRQASKIKIYSKKEAGWDEEEPTASLRETDGIKQRYGFLLPSSTAASSKEASFVKV